MKKVFLIIVCFLLVIGFSHVLLDTGPVYLSPVVESLKKFEFDVKPFVEYLDYFLDGEFFDDLHKWDDALGFFENIGEYIMAFFDELIEFFMYSFTFLFDGIKIVFGTVGGLIDMVVSLFGFR